MVRTTRQPGELREKIALRHILHAIRGIRFGTITLIIQDGVVIQIDQTEKTRVNYAQESHQEGSGI